MSFLPRPRARAASSLQFTPVSTVKGHKLQLLSLANVFARRPCLIQLRARKCAGLSKLNAGKNARLSNNNYDDHKNGEISRKALECYAGDCN